MIKDADCLLKTIIYINHNIPFEFNFKKEREMIFEKIVDSLRSALSYHDYEYQMMPNYISSDTITIFKLNGDSDNWRKDIKHILDNMHNVDIYDRENDSVEEYDNINYMIEFNCVEIFSITE